MATNFHTVVINRNRLLRYKLRAISKYNIYEKQIHQSFGKFIEEFYILKCVEVIFFNLNPYIDTF